MYNGAMKRPRQAHKGIKIFKSLSDMGLQCYTDTIVNGSRHFLYHAWPGILWMRNRINKSGKENNQ